MQFSKINLITPSPLSLGYPPSLIRSGAPARTLLLSPRARSACDGLPLRHPNPNKQKLNGKTM